MQKRLSSDEIKKLIEEKQGTEYEKIRKETERKLFIVRNRNKIIKYFVIGGVALVALIFLVIFVPTLFTNLIREEEQPEPAPVEVEGPPDDFKVEVLDTDLVQTSEPRVYDVVSTIRNTNAEWGVPLLKYKYTFRDDAGAVVGERERTSYILPQQERYVVEIDVETVTTAASVDLAIEILEAEKLEQFINPQAQFTQKNVKYFVGGDKSRVDGVLVNESPFSFDKVDVFIILYNQSNEVVGVNYTNIDDFLAGSERYFSVLWPEIISNENLRVELEPNVNAYEDGSFMDVYGTGDKLEY